MQPALAPARARVALRAAAAGCLFVAGLSAACGGQIGTSDGGRPTTPETPDAEGPDGWPSGERPRDSGSHPSYPSDSGGDGDGDGDNQGMRDAMVMPPGRDSGTPPDDPPPAGTVPLVVAVGYKHRQLVSCDDGRSWHANPSSDPGARCGQGTDCDHDQFAPIGLGYQGGKFFAAWGWGVNGPVEVSSNGQQWTSAAQGDWDGSGRWSGVGAGGGHVLVFGNYNTRGYTAATNTWAQTTSPDFATNVRGNVSYADGVIAALGDGDRQIRMTDDFGASWFSPDSFGNDCSSAFSAGFGGIAGKAGVLALVDGDGTACRSTDGGHNFAFVQQLTNGDRGSRVLACGGQFYHWSEAGLDRSSDGTSWQHTAVTPANVRLDAIACSDAGTFVATASYSGYDQQRLFRSTDGVTWNELAADKFEHGHPIRFTVFGHGTKPAACP